MNQNGYFHAITVKGAVESARFDDKGGIEQVFYYRLVLQNKLVLFE
jgi:hypothetical protein